MEGENMQKDDLGKKATVNAHSVENEDVDFAFHYLFSFADWVDWVLIVGGTVGALLHSLGFPLLFLFLGQVLDTLGTIHEKANAWDAIGVYIMRLVYLGMTAGCGATLEITCWRYTGERQAAQIRVKYISAILNQDVEYFDTHGTIGGLVTSVSTEIMFVRDAIGEKLGNFVYVLGVFSVSMVVGFSGTWQMALVTLALVPAIMIVGGFYAYGLTSCASKVQAAYAKAAGIAKETFDQVRVVYAFGGEKRAIKMYSAALQSSLKAGYRSGAVQGLGTGLVFGVVFGGCSFLLWYGGTLVRSHSATKGNSTTTLFSIMIGALILGQGMVHLSVFSQGKSAGKKIFDMIKSEPKISSTKETGNKLAEVVGNIELRNVVFAYPARPDVAIFKNFSLTISSGKTVAIVGSSGSGKSTVIQLIQRFYDPNQGSVFLDGHDLRSLNLNWLRSKMGLVNQDLALFATSIKANISYGKEDATGKQIETAAKVADAHDFICNFSNGYDTQVGERGVQLSGGQKQRISIARAMIRDPKILLLDEATSALDAASEKIVQETLNHLMVGRTTVMIAHRLSTIASADIIAVIEGTQIVEIGSHFELMAKGAQGSYAALVRLQYLSPSTMNSSTSVAASIFPSRNSLRLSVRRDSGVRYSSDWGANFVPMTKSERCRLKPPSNFVRLLKMNRSEWLLGLSGVGGAVLSGLIAPSFAFVLGSVMGLYYSYDHAYMEAQILRNVTAFLGIAFASPLIYFIHCFFLGVLGENMIKRLREVLLAAMLRNEVSWFEEEDNNSNQLSSRLSSETTNIKISVIDTISFVVQNISTLSGACILAIKLQWHLALVIISTMPLFVLAGIYNTCARRASEGVTDATSRASRATAIAGEAVSNIRMVKAFSAEQNIMQLIHAQLSSHTKSVLLHSFRDAASLGLSQLGLFLAYAVSLWYVGDCIHAGRTSVGEALRVFAILLVAACIIGEAAGHAPRLLRAKSIDWIFNHLDRQPAIDGNQQCCRTQLKTAGIQFVNVTFYYPSRPLMPIFYDLNLTIPAGTSLALVGRSGSGKSSVLALIQRFYDAQGGMVKVDGEDIQKWNLKSLRRHMALVQQEPALFAGTIHDNIVYGRERATEAEIVAAAKVGNAHSFISALPNGYKTEVGDQGVSLSGGQKQRIVIARAVLRDPAILLLDEATSALDVESERLVQQALERLMVRKTTVVVAHRLSTIKCCNTIAVLQDGVVQEMGTHDDLLNSPIGAYARLVNLQISDQKFM